MVGFHLQVKILDGDSALVETLADVVETDHAVPPRPASSRVLWVTPVERSRYRPYEVRRSAFSSRQTSQLQDRHLHWVSSTACRTR